MYGKCPKCEQFISTVNIEPVTGKSAGGVEWKCISYNCPHAMCGTVLSVQIDPTILRTETIEGIAKRFNR